MKNPLLKVASLALAFHMIFASCTKEEEKTAHPEEVAVEDNTIMENESDDVLSLADEFMSGHFSNARVSGENGTVSGPCGSTVEVTKNDDGSEGRIVIDFGTGKSCLGERLRKGKIIINYTGKPYSDNHTRTISLDNYYVNDTKIEGLHTVILSHIEGTTAESAKLTWTIKAERFKLIYMDGKTSKWDSERVRVYDSKGTKIRTDDEITIIGSASGVNRRGIQYSTNVTTPVLLKPSCFQTSGWVPVSGILSITPTDDQKERVVNYGIGNCDRVVTVTVGDLTRDITIK